MRSEAVVDNGLASSTTAKNEVGVPTSHQSNKRKADDRECDSYSETKLLGFGHNVCYVVFINSIEKSFRLKAGGPRYCSHLRLWCHDRVQQCTLRPALD